MAPISSLSLRINVDDRVLVINEDKINRAFVDGPDQVADWPEILCDSISLDVTRSLNTDQSILGQAEAAELVTVITNPRYDPATNKFVKPGVEIQAFSNNEILFTGRIFSVSTEYDRDLKPQITIVAHDATEMFNNTITWRADPESFSARLAALASEVGVEYIPPIGPIPQPVQRAAINYYTGGNNNYSPAHNSTTWSSYNFYFNWDSTQPVSGLPGRRFYIQAEYWTVDLGLEPTGNIKTVRNPLNWKASSFIFDGQKGTFCGGGRMRLVEKWYTDNPWNQGGVELLSTPGDWVTVPTFGSDAQSVPEVNLTLPAVEIPSNAGWWRATVEWEIDSRVVNQGVTQFDTVYMEIGSSDYWITLYNNTVPGVTLSRHENDASAWDLVTLAVNSEAGLAYVNREGKLVAEVSDQFEESHTPYLHFSNIHDTSDPLHACFTDMEVVFDTQNVVNELEISNIINKGYGGDYEEVLDPYVDAQSKYDNGVRRASIQTNLTNMTDIDAVGNRVLALFKDAKRRVNTIVFKPETPYQTLIDLGNYVTFNLAIDNEEFQGTYLVVGLEHDVVPDDWTTTLYLERAR